MNAEERPAEPGDLCTCGRQAVTVHLTERYDEVGDCGQTNVAAVTPCPFCGSTDPHEARCPSYRLRPAEALDEVLFGAIRDHRDCPREPELAPAWILGWLTAQLADNWPEVARTLIARADGGRP